MPVSRCKFVCTRDKGKLHRPQGSKLATFPKQSYIPLATLYLDPVSLTGHSFDIDALA
jgi:hypothetical protein